MMHKLLKLPWGMILTVTLLVLVIVGPSIAPYDPIAVDLNNALQGPSAAHLVGTDQLGRDVFSRLLTGGQTTVGACTVDDCRRAYWPLCRLSRQICGLDPHANKRHIHGTS